MTENWQNQLPLTTTDEEAASVATDNTNHSCRPPLVYLPLNMVQSSRPKKENQVLLARTLPI